MVFAQLMQLMFETWMEYTFSSEHTAYAISIYYDYDPFESFLYQDTTRLHCTPNQPHQHHYYHHITTSPHHHISTSRISAASSLPSSAIQSIMALIES